MPRGAQRGTIERETDPELHRRRECELHPDVPQDVRRGPHQAGEAAPDDEETEDERDRDATFERHQFFRAFRSQMRGVLVGGHALVAGRHRLVSRIGDRFLDITLARLRRVVGDGRFVGCEVHRGIGDARHLAKRLFDEHHAGCAMHPFDGEGCFDVGHGRYCYCTTSILPVNIPMLQLNLMIPGFAGVNSMTFSPSCRRREMRKDGIEMLEAQE